MQISWICEETKVSRWGHSHQKTSHYCYYIYTTMRYYFGARIQSMAGKTFLWPPHTRFTGRCKPSQYLIAWHISLNLQSLTAKTDWQLSTKFSSVYPWPECIPPTQHPLLTSPGLMSLRALRWSKKLLFGKDASAFGMQLWLPRVDDTTKTKVFDNDCKHGLLTRAVVHLIYPVWCVCLWIMEAEVRSTWLWRLTWALK
jgi:hypothetical protein